MVWASKWFGSAPLARSALPRDLKLRLLRLCFFVYRPDAFSSRSRPRAAPLTPCPRGTPLEGARRKRLMDRFALHSRPKWTGRDLDGIDEMGPQMCIYCLVQRAIPQVLPSAQPLGNMKNGITEDLAAHTAWQVNTYACSQARKPSSVKVNTSGFWQYFSTISSRMEMICWGERLYLSARSVESRGILGAGLTWHMLQPFSLSRASISARVPNHFCVPILS